MGKYTEKIGNNLKKKNQLIGVILIAVIVVVSIVAIGFITNGNKVIDAESDSSISAKDSASSKPAQDKTACGIKIKFLYEDKYWEKYDLTNAVYKTQEEYEDAVCNYIDEIAKLLNKEDWYEQNKDKDTLYLKLTIEGKEYYEKRPQYYSEEFDDTMPISNGSGLGDYTPKACIYEICLNSAIFDHDFVPIVHQLTDLITYNKDKDNHAPLQVSSFSNSLRIGLNEYVQNYLGMGIASCNHGLDIHNYVIEHEKKYKNELALGSYISTKGLFWNGVTYGSLGIGGSLQERNFGVECCSSFVDYLVQTYGLENVIKMVDGYDNSIYYLFNQNGIEGLISDWQKYLSDYPCKMTWDEMNAYMTEFRNTHGY